MQLLASVLAGLSVLACLVAAVWGAMAGGFTFAVATNRPAGVLVFFLPIALAAVGLHAARRGSFARIWFSAGLLCGTLTIFSISRGVAPAALLMVLAAVAYSIPRGSWWILTAPLWMFAGITAIPLMLVIFGRIDFPINIFGSWLFAGTVLALALCHTARYMWRHGSGRSWVPFGFAMGFLLLAGAFVFRQAIDAWQHVRQGHW